MTTVVLLRHGRTKANATGVLAGRSSGVGLDETGEQQALAAAQRLAGAPVKAVVSSPLLRCRRTASAVAEQHVGLAVETHPGLIECGYGEWTGRQLAELAKEPLWQTVQNQPSAVRFPGGESLVEMSSRAVQAIRDTDAAMAAAHGENAVWVAVSHGDVIKAILADALGVHLDSFQRILVDPASVSVIRFTAARPYVACTNTVTGDLTDLLTAPKTKAGRRRRRSDSDAPVGGGLGAHGH
ncbi:MAG: MSMEG_4193 family putative phosphomutase, partial [Propionibacteriales bacterium]|nr:MSMEG_4193 family putative phosphomutase [Propionibacteriales bacterium]